MRAARTTVAIAAVASLVALVTPTGASEGPVNCADAPYNGTISGTVRGNVEVTAYPSVCLITGTVEGNVTARNESEQCDAGYPPVTAINVVGGTIRGNALSYGATCVMIWLRDGATVTGNVIHRSDGNLGFLGNGSGATVEGNAILQDGHLFATGSSTANIVSGNLICNGGEPQGSGTGTGSDWDADGDLDGTIGKNYLGC